MLHGYVYGLLEPRTFELRYIGQTIKHPAARLAAHLTPGTLRKHSYVARWLSGLVKKGLKPIIAVLDVAHDQAELDRLEVEHIARYRENGFRLVNLSNGGGGRAGYVPPRKERDKIAAAQRGIPKPKHTAEWKLRMSALMTGRKAVNPPEHYTRLAEMKRGVPRSEETKAKISKTKTGQPSGRKGVKHTEATKGRISAARSGQLLKENHFAYRHDIQTTEILRLLGEGKTKVQVAMHFKVSPTFVHRRLSEARRDGLEVPKTVRNAWKKKTPLRL